MQHNINASNFHRENLICKFGDNLHKCIFLYKTDILPESRSNPIMTFNNIIEVNIIINGIERSGKLLYNNIALISDFINPSDITLFTIDRKSNIPVNCFKVTTNTDEYNKNIKEYEANKKKKIISHELVFIPFKQEYIKRYLKRICLINGEYFECHILILKSLVKNSLSQDEIYEDEIDFFNPSIEIKEEKFNEEKINEETLKIEIQLIEEKDRKDFFGFHFNMGVFVNFDELVDSSKGYLCLFDYMNPISNPNGRICNIKIKGVKSKIYKFISNDNVKNLLGNVSVDYPNYNKQSFCKKFSNAGDSLKLENNITFGEFIKNTIFVNKDDSNFVPDDIIEINNFLLLSFEGLHSFLKNPSNNKEENSKEENDKFNSSFNKFVIFWKEYSYKRMKYIMENASIYNSESISNCIFMSIRIIKEYPNFTWDWDTISANSYINDIDVLMNPNLNWNYTHLMQNRRLPKHFYFDAKVSNKTIIDNEVKTNVKYSEMDYLMSENPNVIIPTYEDKKEIVELNEEDINVAMSLLSENNPDFFIDISDKRLDEIRNEVISNIKEYETFNESEFYFPEDDDFLEEIRSEHELEINNDRSLNKYNIKTDFVEKTEDDPYGLSAIIDSIKKTDSYNDSIKYRTLIIPGTTESSIEYHPKNRNEYLQIISSVTVCKYDDEFEKYIFFELDDIDNYPKAFYRRDETRESIITKTRFFTLEYMNSNPQMIFSLKDLVSTLPCDFVFNNLLFYPDRIKLKNISENWILESETNENIHKMMLKYDKEIKKSFVERKDLDFDISFQFHEMNFLPKYNSRKPLHLSSPKEKTLIRSYNSYDVNSYKLTWESLKTEKGITALSKMVKIRVKNPEKLSELDEEEKIKFVMNYIKSAKSAVEIISDIIPDNIKVLYPKNKWYTPSCVELELILKEFKEIENSNKEEILPFILFLQENRFIDSTLFELLPKLFKYYIEKHYSLSENKSESYETFINSLMVIYGYFKIFCTSGSIKYHIEEILLELSSVFNIADIGNSEYSYPDKIIKNLLKNNSNNSYDEDSDDEDIEPKTTNKSECTIM